MKAILPFLLSLLAAGCAAFGELTPNELFGAGGADWGVTLGGGQIRFTTGPARGRHLSPENQVFIFPMVQGHRLGDSYVWESQGAGRRIAIETQRLPCVSTDGFRLAETVRVRLDGREFRGCGSRQFLVRG